VSSGDISHFFSVDQALIANGGVGTATVYYNGVNLLVDTDPVSIKNDGRRDNAVLRECSCNYTGSFREEQPDVFFIGTGSFDSSEYSAS
jgi:hypothetical protein